MFTVTPVVAPIYHLARLIHAYERAKLTLLIGPGKLMSEPPIISYDYKSENSHFSFR